MPSLTPSQRVFGVGLTPIERAFRPPQGMENDPAYNDYARRKFAAADMEDAQRGQVQEALAAQEDARAQRAQDRQMQQVEQRATEALRGKSPEEIPNILAQFPELARSRNLGGFTNFAQAVTPSAGQRTLAPSLRMKLKPYERQYFDEDFATHGDAVKALENAQLRGEHENALVDMMKSGVPLDVIDKYRGRPLNPIERETIVQQYSSKGGVKDHPLKEAYDLDLKMMYEDPDFIALPPADKAKRVREMRLAYELDKAAIAENQATNAAATAQQVAATVPVTAAAPVAAPMIQDVDLSKIPYAEREKYVADIENQAKESEEINKKWHQAQNDLQSKLEKEIGTGNIGNTNYSKLRSFAEAVVNDDTTPTGELGTGGEYRMDVLVGDAVLKKLGLSPEKAAFAEPGNRRVGTQKVTYGDLLKTWAKNYLDTAPKTVVPQVPALPMKKAQAVDSVLDSLLKPSNS